MRFPRLTLATQVACCVLLLLVVTACAASDETRGTRPDPATARAGGRTGASAAGRRRVPEISASSCSATIAPGFSCTMRHRIADVEWYLQHAPGEIGIEVHDRKTGATWQNANALERFPAGSTIKLAMAADLLLRNSSGDIQLSSDDWAELDSMLHASSDSAANDLWSEYEDDSFLGRVQQFGMDGAVFTQQPGYWGYMYCTASDLSNLVGYILSGLPRSIRSYLVSELQGVAGIQQWGVWGAGHKDHPGNKDGWEDDHGTWVTDSAGFAGPDGRYTLAMMYDLEGYGSDGDDGFSYGTNSLTQISSILFRGRHTVTPGAQATP